ncbi:MAG: hypothetical protein AMXMBFR83_00490 [Phycisphaerae bacterium]
MTLRVKLFGPQARLAGRREIAVELPGPAPTCAELRDALARAAERLAPSLPASRFAVNQHYVRDDHPLREQDEIALIGMISGG